MLFYICLMVLLLLKVGFIGTDGLRISGGPPCEDEFL